MHYEQLDEKETTLLDTKVSSTDPTYDVVTRAYVNIPEVQWIEISPENDDSVKLGNFEYFGIGNNADGSDMQIKDANNSNFLWFNNSFYLFHPI